MKKIMMLILLGTATLLFSGCSSQQIEQEQFASDMKKGAYQQISENVFFLDTDAKEVVNEQIKLILVDNPTYQIDKITQMFESSHGNMYTNGVYVIMKKK